MVVKLDTYILGLLILIVLICAILVLGSPWLDRVHKKYIEPYENSIVSNLGNRNSYGLNDIRYPNGNDYIELTFANPLSSYSDLVFNSTTNSKQYKVASSDISSDKKTVKIYIDPGEYTMELTDNETNTKTSDRVVINPFFNYQDRNDDYIRLPNPEWSDSENIMIGVSIYDNYQQATSYYLRSDTGFLDLGNVEMLQFNNVKFSFKIPDLFDYRNKLLQIGFSSKSKEREYKARMADLESYYPTEFIYTIKIIGKRETENGLLLPAEEKRMQPKLVFQPISKSGYNIATIKNVYTNYVYEVNIRLKFSRPDSTGYRTSLPLVFQFRVINTNNNDISSNPNIAANKLTSKIISDAKTKLKFETDQANQDSKLDILESTQDRLFMVAGNYI